MNGVKLLEFSPDYNLRGTTDIERLPYDVFACIYVDVIASKVVITRSRINRETLLENSCH